MALVRWLQGNTGEDDEVFIWGREPAVNYLAARRAPTRFIHNYDFRFPWRDPGLERELLEALDRARPEVFVISSNDVTIGASGSPLDSRELLFEFPELLAWVSTHYGEVVTIGRFEVLQRVPGL